MSDIGFLYVLANRAMPGIYKIGFTLRAPHARAEELSSGTAVPFPFEIATYWEVEDPRSAELEIHQFLSEFRCNHGREFFQCDLEMIVDTFRMHAFPYAEFVNSDYFPESVHEGDFKVAEEADHGTRKEH